MNAREVISSAVEAYFSDTLDGGNIADVVLERMEAAGFTIMSKEDVEAVREKALEEAANVAKTGWISADYDTVGIADADMAMALCAHIESTIRSLKSGGSNAN